jgi:hypothetical protein
MASAGPQGHFYGDVFSKYEKPTKDKQGHDVEFLDYWDEDGEYIYWQYYCPVEEKNVILTELKRAKEEAQTTQEAYQLTQDEYDTLTREAWETQCPECFNILQKTNIDETGNRSIYPSSKDAEHMGQLFGYPAEPAETGAEYLDPSDPKWQSSVEHIQERQQSGGGGTFGPQSGMERGEPTRHEWGVTSYLDNLGVKYVHKMKLGELDPGETEHPDIEYDIYIPEFNIAVESSPGWHEGGKTSKNFPQVAFNDQYKKKFAKENGIELFVYDPDMGGSEGFINDELAPALRTHGIDAFDVPSDKKPQKEEEDVSQIWCNTHDKLYGEHSPEEIDIDVEERDYARQFSQADRSHIKVLEICERDCCYSDKCSCSDCPRCGSEIGAQPAHPEPEKFYRDPTVIRDRPGQPKREARDDSQNFPRHPSLGDVNTIRQEGPQVGNKSHGMTDDLEATGHLFHEQDDEFEKGNPFNQQYIYREEGQELSIIVPIKFNDGKPVPSSYFQEFETFLDNEFKGWSKVPISGGWVSSSGENIRDESMKYSVYAEDFDENLLNAIADVVGAFWQQHSVVYDLKPSDTHVVEPETEKEESQSTELIKLADDYNAQHGLEKIKPVESEQLDEETGMEIADVYDTTEHDPENPEVKASYEVFKTEILAQYDFVKEHGIKFEYQKDDPYPDLELKTMLKDIEENHRLKVFTGGEPLQSDHPLAEKIPDEEVTYNEAFRGVHDLFGHIAHNNPITFTGEFHAFLTHMQMFSPEARGAMAWETLANTNWFQYIGKGKTFAPQKANIYTDIPSSETQTEKNEAKTTNPALAWEVEIFGPIAISEVSGELRAICREDREEFTGADYDKVAEWVLGHLEEMHPDEQYSPSMNPPKDTEGTPVGLGIDEVKELRE